MTPTASHAHRAMSEGLSFTGWIERTNGLRGNPTGGGQRLATRDGLASPPAVMRSTSIFSALLV